MYPLFIKPLNKNTMSKFNGQYFTEALTKKAINAPVSIEEVKRNLRFDEPAVAHDDDTTIEGLIEAARDAAETYCGRIFAKSEVRFYAYNFSSDSLKIDVAPYLSMKSIRKSTTNGASFTTLTETTDYQVLKRATYFEIYFTTTQTADELEVLFYAGYDEGSEFPPNVKKWIIVEASDGYDTDRSQYTYQVDRSELKQRSLNAYVIPR